MNANDPAVSVVVPVRNEAGNIAPLVAEIAAALAGRWPFEIVYVNDGSTDGTEAELDAADGAASLAARACATSTPAGNRRRCAPACVAARAPLIVTLDGDGQNDPAFIPALLRALGQPARRASG